MKEARQKQATYEWLNLCEISKIDIHNGYLE